MFAAVTLAAQPPVTTDIAMRAAARARGNDRADAIAIGQAVLAQPTPAQITLVRCERASGHRVCGLVLSGVKFKRALDRAGFLAEVDRAIATAFAAAPVEEVDVWATVPLSAGHGAVVSGDFAQPTSATVFAVSVPRRMLGGLSARLSSSRDVYWDPVFAKTLATGAH